MTASPMVLVAIKKLSLPVEAQAFLAAITEGEGGDLPNRLYGGGTLRQPSNPDIGKDSKGRIWTGSLDTFPDWGGAWLSSNGRGDFSTAAGVAQFTGTTWRRVSKITGITAFGIEEQLKNGWWLASDDFMRRSKMDLLECIQKEALELIPLYLIQTWPGGASSTFPKRYAKNLVVLQDQVPIPPDPNGSYEITGSLQMKEGRPISIIMTLRSP